MIPPKSIVYVPIVADLFHYGHLHILEYAKTIGDYIVCGLVTDEGVLTYRQPTITNFQERKAVLSSVKYVDEIVEQHSKDTTGNLRKLHERHPSAKMILLHGDDWKNVPGATFIKEIGGDLIQPPYYKRLSTKKIVTDIQDKYKNVGLEMDLFTDFIKLKDILGYDPKNFNHIISTKAETLKTLGSMVKKSIVEKAFVFDVKSWKENSADVISKIQENFQPAKIVVRSSAINEDTFESSMAGYFESILNVDSSSKGQIKSAAEAVMQSYLSKNSVNDMNLVLVQSQTQDVWMSGVIFTCNPHSQAPYYIINYDDDTGLTDTVTSGVEGKMIEILCDANPKSIPEKFRSLLEAVHEIEDMIPNVSLDVEFAIKKNGEVVIFQVRPIVLRNRLDTEKLNRFHQRINQMKDKFTRLSAPKTECLGKKNAFSDMAFWNPSEIIGDSPNNLDYSLYAYLITDQKWLEGLLPLGYKNIAPAPLMVRFGNKPYIDLRNAFNALFVKTIPDSIQQKLFAHFLHKLEINPELHDKIEFDVHYTCYDFSLTSRLRELEGKLSKSELTTLRTKLLNFTNHVLKNYKKIVAQDAKYIKRFEKQMPLKHYASLSPIAKVTAVKKLLNDCREHGTAQFSRIARMAFIGNAIFKSLVKEKVISQSFYDDFVGSVRTVASELNHDLDKAAANPKFKSALIGKYGHLRPGTYDILSDRYDHNVDAFLKARKSTMETNKKAPKLPASELKKVNDMMKAQGIKINFTALLTFVEMTTRLREYFKFQFTKNLSHSLQIISMLADDLGIGKANMAHLDINSILRLADENENEEILLDQWNRLITSAKEEKKLNELLALPPLVFDKRDFDVITFYDARPNFITQKKGEGELLILENGTGNQKLNGKIIAIEKADPGYDWVFAHDIGGLITKYGGVASHMAIRCSEFQIPAAIGCGKRIYESLKSKQTVVLDCGAKKIIC